MKTGGSSNGRTADSDSASQGSNPCPPTSLLSPRGPGAGDLLLSPSRPERDAPLNVECPATIAPRPEGSGRRIRGSLSGDQAHYSRHRGQCRQFRGLDHRALAGLSRALLRTTTGQFRAAEAQSRPSRRNVRHLEQLRGRRPRPDALYTSAATIAAKQASRISARRRRSRSTSRRGHRAFCLVRRS